MKIILALLLIALPMAAKAVDHGNGVGNGGDVFALQFVSIAGKVLNHLKTSPMQGVPLQTLQQALDETVVESVNYDLVLNGMTKDAINYPSTKKIIFNRPRWVQIAEEDKPALVLHEYLGVIGSPDVGYKYSKQILGDFRLSKEFAGARLGNYGNVSAQCGLRVLSSNSSQLNLQYIHNPESGYECNDPSLLPSTGAIRLACNDEGNCESQTFDIKRMESSIGGGGYWSVHYKFKVVVHVYKGGEIDFGMKNLSCPECRFTVSEEVQQFSFKNTDADLRPSLFVVRAYFSSSDCELAKAVAFKESYKKCKSNGYLDCREVNTRGEGGPGYCIGTSSFKGF